MIIRELSLKASPQDGVVTLTIAVGKSAAMEIDLVLNGPVTAEGWIDVQSADLAEALHSMAAALPKLAPTL